MSNTIEKSVLRHNPKMRTIKEDKTNHGYGMKKIKKIVEKYNGLMKCDEKDNMFIVKAMLVDS
jgi:sensor histidine kinase regulating citrate/malate metabolism